MTNHDDGRRNSHPQAGDAREWLEAVRSRYNPPPDPPREEMWAAIRQGLLDADAVREGAAGEGGGGRTGGGDGALLDLADARRRRGRPGPGRGALLGRWAWATAAAAVLAVGIGIGRWSAPSPDASFQGPSVAAQTPTADAGSGVELAARLHFGRSESLLTAVRSDARAGRMDGSVGPWARTLLTQTRLLMDARGGARDETQRLLADLELVLVQIVGATETGSMDEERARQELDLVIRSLEQGEVMNRVRSAAPPTMAGA